MAPNASPFIVAQKDGDALTRGFIERPLGPTLLKEMLVRLCGQYLTTNYRGLLSKASCF